MIDLKYLVQNLTESKCSIDAGYMQSSYDDGEYNSRSAKKNSLNCMCQKLEPITSVILCSPHPAFKKTLRPRNL